MTPFAEPPGTTWVVGAGWKSALRERIAEWIDDLPDDGVFVATEFTLDASPLKSFGVFTSPPGKQCNPVFVAVLGDTVRTNALRGVPLADMESTAFFRRAEQLHVTSGDNLRLSREGLSPLAFSQRVADAYNHWALRVPNPALKLAEENGVKPSTVHSWIREARLRNLLPPAGEQRPGPPPGRRQSSAATVAAVDTGSNE